MEKETIPTCVDCGTQNCKYKDRTYPDFCPTENLKEEDRQWALERYDEGRNREIMIASAEVEYEGLLPVDPRAGNHGICPENRCAPHRHCQLHRPHP